jgi:Sigma 54 modulation protein / S30EA ribosomal protein
MQIPLQTSFGNTHPSPAVEAIVRQKAAKLDRLFERIVSCDATIEAPHRRQHKSKLYKFRIDIGMPGKDVHVNQEGPKTMRTRISMSPCATPSTPRCASSRIMRGGCEATSNRMRLRL